MKIISYETRRSIVYRIVSGDLNSALELLSTEYGVAPPAFRVGTVKGHRNVAACYQERQGTIVFSSREILRDPSVVLHEFYHHLIASKTLKGGGNDKNAERFARQFLSAFPSLE
ncbi:hypothetical protein KEJ39_08945 [Candidatus Bathyarchaeota archaeon]|nr:hypothetical protein [Candidatus Bathyarchaeota archaeon]